MRQANASFSAPSIELLCCRTLAYLQAAQAQLLNATNINGGLRPTEVRLPSGCIQEEDANYKGTLVSPVLNNTMDGDQCCQMCRCECAPNLSTLAAVLKALQSQTEHIASCTLFSGRE